MFFFIYIKIAKKLSAKCYQENKERLRKRLVKDIKIFLKMKKNKNIQSLKSLSIKSSISRNIKKICKTDFSWIRLNYTMTYHDPPPPTTIQNISTTTHHHPPPSTITYYQPKYVDHHPPPSTTFHHQPKYIHNHPPPAKIYPPLPTISHKMDDHPAKAKVYSYITSFRHCFNSFFVFQMQYFFLSRIFCVITF